MLDGDSVVTNMIIHLTLHIKQGDNFYKLSLFICSSAKQSGQRLESDNYANELNYATFGP